MTVTHLSDGQLVVRVLVGFGLAYVLGFERGLRGSAAGTRTFALVGAASACVASVASTTPQVLAGIISGVGFIGGGVILQQREPPSEGGNSPATAGTIVGITTAATIFAAASSGIVVGTGHLALGLLTTALVLIVLELPYIRVLSVLDARRYAGRFRPDREARSGDSHP